MDTYDFQKELRKSIFNADEKLDKKELLVDIFKTYVAKLFEITLQKSASKNQLELSALIEVKKNLISEFRQADLSEYQLSVNQYEDLFDKTVKEIVNFASLRHKGEDSININKTLSVDKSAFWAGHTINDSGLIVPK